MNERPRYSRNDLEELKEKNRSDLFDIFGSFDERPLDDAAFARAAADLVDPAKVPRLDQAIESGDANTIAGAILAACRKDPKSATSKSSQMGTPAIGRP
jgi:hypothetical protein